MQQQVKLTSLPNGITPDGGTLKLSVFVSPELKATTGPEAGTYVTLDGTIFKDWPATVRGIRFEVFFSDAPNTPGSGAAARITSQAPDAALWGALLGHTEALLEPLNPPGQPGMVPVQTYSYDAKRIDVALTRLYVDSASRSIENLRVSKSRSSLATTVVEPAIPSLPDIEYLLTSPTSFNHVVPVPPAPCLPNEECPGEEAPQPGSDKEALKSAIQFHTEQAAPPTPPRTSPIRQPDVVQANFETTSPALPPERPTAGTKAAAQVPEVEFHERVSQLGEYPALLRQLGLAFDLQVELGSNIPVNGLVWVRATTPIGFIQIAPKTTYELNRATRRFMPVSCSTNPQLRDGLLRLDDTGAYGVIQTDLDGAVLKAVDFTRNLLRISRSPAEDKPAELAPPSLRTAGVSVVKKGRLQEVLAQLSEPLALCALANTGQDIILNAEHLVRGYRVDVWGSGKNPGRWRSLCARNVRFEIPDIPQNPPGEVADEGWVSLGISEETTPEGTQKRYIHESLFLWNGWSLVAPRPGRAADESGNPETAAPSGPARGSLLATTTARPGTVTPLRFGYRYRLRARAVDLSGNDIPTVVPADFTSATPEFIYRRLEPVNSPVLAAREDLKKYPGETMDRVVLRSNYNTKPVREPERHVAPPKTSEFMAETHGKLDGAQAPDKASYDLIVARDNNLDADAIHPEQQLKLPYLPDPLSRGAAFHGLPGTNDTFATAFDGNWPDAMPFRLALTEGDGPPLWDPGARVLRVHLRKAQIVDVRLSSHLNLSEPNRADLGLLQAWQWLTELSPPPDPSEALKGRMWILTPFRELTLMHAVQQPLSEPLFENQSDPASTPFSAEKTRIGNTFADVAARVYFDRESTGKIELMARWIESLDDPLRDAPEILDRNAQVFERNIKYPRPGPSEPGEPQQVSGGWVLPFETRHEFGDTKYRRVSYSAVATTRFREQFNFTDEEITQGKSITRETPASARPVRDILNSARPEAPQVRYIIPLFGWTPPKRTKDKKAKIESVSRERKGGGLRIYLERPWYSSGDGELLGVVLWPGAASHLRGGLLAQAGAAIGLGTLPPEIPTELKPYVSQWGMDPLWRSNPLDAPLSPQHFLTAITSAPVDPQRKYTLEEFSQDMPYKPERLVSVVAFKPEFDQVRKLWYCDVEMDTQGAYYPFVRFALVRFQPKSVVEAGAGGVVARDCHLSRVVLAEFVQLTPGRTATVTLDRKKKKVARVSIVGVTFQKSDVGDSGGEMELTLETRNQRVGSGWFPVPGSVVHLTPQPAGNGKESVWSGDVPLQEDFDDEDYRLVIREYERFRADSSLDERRLVYADVLEF